MARKFLTALDLSKNELQNAVVQNLAAAPSSPGKGQLYFDSTGNVLYWWNGTTWVAAQSGGTIAFGSITQEQTFGAVKSDGVATTAARSDHAHGNPVHDSAAHSAIPLSALAAATAAISMGGFKITNVADPTAGTDAANKQYVDNGIAGLSWKEAVRIGSTANIAALSGLTAIDGVTPIANDRVLLKDQTTQSQNGIWLAQSGAWTRALDADAVGELEGAAMFVMEGTVNADTAWVCSTNGAITPGTTAITFAQFSANTGQYVKVAGDTMTGKLTITGSGSRLSLPAGAFDAASIASAGGITGNTLGLSGSGAALTVGGSLSSVDFSGVAAQAVLPAITPTLGNHATTKTYVDGLVTAKTSKFAAACAAATSTVVTHNLNTRDVEVSVYRLTTPWDDVECDVERTTVNTVTVRFAVAPAAGDYQIVVVG